MRIASGETGVSANKPLLSEIVACGGVVNKKSTPHGMMGSAPSVGKSNAPQCEDSMTIAADLPSLMPPA